MLRVDAAAASPAQHVDAPAGGAAPCGQKHVVLSAAQDVHYRRDAVGVFGSLHLRSVLTSTFSPSFRLASCIDKDAGVILCNPLVLLLFNSDPLSFLPSLSSLLQAEWLQDQIDALRGCLLLLFSSSDDLFFPPKCWGPFSTLLAESYYCLGVLSAQKQDKEQMVRSVEMGLIVECCMKDKSVLIPFKRLLWNTFDIPSCFPDVSDTSVFFFLFQLFLDLPDILPPLSFTSSLVGSLHSCPFPLSTNLPLTFILRDIVPSLFTLLV